MPLELGGPNLPNPHVQERQKVHQLFYAHMQEHADLYVAAGQPTDSMRLGFPSPKSSDGMRWDWCISSTEATNTYRTVLPLQLVFDIGDKPATWADCVRRSHALWDALNWLGLGYWACLSGGAGTHTEVFGTPTWLPPVPEWSDAHGRPLDWREEVAKTISGVAQIFLTRSLCSPEEMVYDYRLIAPRAGRRMVRDFGVEKHYGTGRRKVLWGTGPSPIPRLPHTRDLAYAEVERRAKEHGTTALYPTTIPVNESLDRLAYIQVRQQTGKACPTSVHCLPGPHRGLDPWPWCDTCPMVT